MLGDNFRPWGLLPWVLDRLSHHAWSFLGSISGEDRCLATWQTLTNRGLLGDVHFMDVQDHPSAQYSERAEQLRQERRSQFLEQGGDQDNIDAHELFEKIDILVKAVDSFAATAGDSLLLDISCFPERFFFPIVRRLMIRESIQNIIITYAMPASYSSDPLGINPESWKHIPLFAPPYPEPEQKMLIVGTGFEPLGLPQLLESGLFGAEEVRLLFPSPSPPPSYEKNWRFVHQLESKFGCARCERLFVDKLDVSDVFDRIRSLTRNGERYAIFAPYGPKPVSLAMCLYATSAIGQQTGSTVWYTQPKTYNPDYSKGVSQIDGGPAVYAYCIRLNGNDLYT